MIVDSSAILAILEDEPLGEDCLRALESASTRRMSAATFLEVSIVVDNSPNPSAAMRFEELMLEYDVIIEPVTESLARLARLAHRRYGRGNDSKAKLNFGDCFAYALARERNEPLLFVGDDFIHTDIRAALNA
jgi:ribonuclease VapC